MKSIRECLLYTFVDTAYLAGRTPEAVCRALCDGGSDVIQLRAKDLPIAKVRAVAQQLVKITAAHDVAFVVNDYPDVAAEVGAAFCHLGQEDFFDRGYAKVAAVVHPSVQAGLSSHSPEQAKRAMAAGAAYIAVGPVYATPTKPGRPAVTLDYVRWAAANVSIPWFAIGGIELARLEEVLEAGARRICVVSAILNSADIARTCQAFKERLLSASRNQ